MKSHLSSTALKRPNNLWTIKQTKSWLWTLSISLFLIPREVLRFSNSHQMLLLMLSYQTLFI